MILVIGAGACGLAAAYALARRGEAVVVLERAVPCGEQSAGLARIFRVAHRRAGLCALALEARAGWLRWEAELGAGRLLGSEGFIAAGPRADTAAAMEAAGARASWIDAREIAARIPFAAPPWETAVLDPLGGSLRIRRALQALARTVEIRTAHVVSVAGDGSVTLADGSVLRGHSVLICAGTATPALAATAGIALEAEFGPHVRFTYAGADAAGAACLAAPEGYGLPLGSTGRWAFGMDEHEPEVVRALFPRLEPVGRVECVTVRAPWLDAGGDGWAAARRERVVAFTGSNLMKFAPLLGERLAEAAIGGGLPADLNPERW